MNVNGRPTSCITNSNTNFLYTQQYVTWNVRVCVGDSPVFSPATLITPARDKFWQAHLGVRIGRVNSLLLVHKNYLIKRILIPNR